nr:hypothetical protein [Rhodoferax sp.]
MRNQKIKTLFSAVAGVVVLLQAPGAWAGGDKPALSGMSGIADHMTAGRSDIADMRQDAWTQVPQDVQVTSPDSVAAMQQSQCKIAGPSGIRPFPSGNRTPAGNVVVRMKFVQSDAPPEVEVLYSARHHLLASTGASMAQEYRMHCEKPLAAPVYATQTVRLRTADAQGAAVKDMAFVPFLQSLDRASLGKVKFDLNTMSCPFDVKVTLIEPFAENTIAEAEARDPNRQEFLSWMRKVVFKYPPQNERFLVGESTKVTVPCMVLDLT